MQRAQFRSRLGLIILGVLFSGLALGQGRRRLVFDVTEIEGKVQKPEITIFISRQNLDTAYTLELKESFIPKIIKSVDDKPF